MRSIFVLFALIVTVRTENVTETEMFTIPIKPNMFNWTYPTFDKQFSYRASILNKPDLPAWLHYTYSTRHHYGYVFGTPPLNQADITLQIVGLDRETYETRQISIPLHIEKRSKMARYQVQLKIDNLNVEDMLDDYRMEDLKDIFRKNLWKDSVDSLYTTFMVSAIELGARHPLKPNDGEGVVVKLGSYKSHSTELLQLQEEVRPLFKKTACPKGIKRTSVERFFRDVGFNLDWCSFRLIESKLDDKPGFNNGSKLSFDKPTEMYEQNWWIPPLKSEIPTRSYVGELSVTIILPLFLMIVLVSIVTMILCFDHDGISRNVVSDSKVELSLYHSDGSGVTEANPSNSAVNIHDCLGDNLSNKSNLGVSPNNSLSKQNQYKAYSNLIVDYNRPQPPPYLGSNTNTLIMRRQNLDDELVAKQSQARALEESLKMLNDANIVNPNFQIDDGYSSKNLLDDEMFYDGIDPQDRFGEYISSKSENNLSLRNNGILNGSINNGNILKSYEGM